MMDSAIGRFPTQIEIPQPIKFAAPIVLVPELFTTHEHLAGLMGYLGTHGWEVYAPDFRAVASSSGGARALGRMDFSGALALVEEAIAEIGRDAIVMGHGLGGLIGMALAERPHVRAAIALAPALPGFPSPLLLRPATLFALVRGRPLGPPRGRVLAAFIANAETFQQRGLIEALVPDAARVALECARGRVHLGRFGEAAPRLIVVGDADPFAPIERARTFAGEIGARLVTLSGRGHWLVGGRTIELVVREAERFLMRTLGTDLMLR